MAVKIVDGLFEKIVTIISEPIKGLFGIFASTPDVINQFTFIDAILSRFQLIATSILVLIVIWQSFKASFAFLGFECEEPWRIGGRAIIFQVLISYAKDVTFLVLDIFKNFIDCLWGAFNIITPSTEQFKNLIMGLMIPGVNLTLFSFTAIMFIYLTYKFIKLTFRFAERLMLTVLLIIISPLAFASGTSQVTKGFLQGWIKLFVGNLVIQMMQVGIVIAMILYRATDKDILSVFSFIVTVSMIKVMEKLEDVVRDASVNVGIGRDVSSSIQKINSVIHSATQGTQLVNSVKTLFKK